MGIDFLLISLERLPIIVRVSLDYHEYLLALDNLVQNALDSTRT